MTGADALPYPPGTPHDLDAAAARCERAAAWARAFASGLERDGRRLSGTWEGVAAVACRREVRLVTALAASVEHPLREAGHSVRAHAAVVERARAEVDRLRRRHDDLAESHRRELAVLQATTGIPFPLRRLQAEDLQGVLSGELDPVFARHRELLREVAEHASRTARRILAAATDLLPRGVRPGGAVDGHEADLAALLPMLDASRRAAGVGGTPPPPGTPPKLVRAWWSALTPGEQDRLVDTFPSDLGSLVGLSAAVRSRANEAALDAVVVALRTGGAHGADAQRRLDSALTVRDQLARVRARTDPVTRQALVAQLLVFEPEAFGGRGRVALAVGDVDTADHVAFLVPGLGADVAGDLAALTADATRLTTAARRAAVTTGTATVAWMGYDAPGLGEVAFGGAAEAGADLLAGDVLAVQASRDVLPHLTVVGHSYGSTTTGTALRDHVTGVDDAVLVGSPGPNVESAAELGVPAGHVFVGASSRDPISYVDRFGADPTHEDFGAYRFQAENPTRNRFMLDLDDHSKYFDPKSESLANIVHVVVGDYAALRPAAYRDEAWLLPDGINSDPEADREPTLVP